MVSFFLTWLRPCLCFLPLAQVVTSKLQLIKSLRDRQRHIRKELKASSQQQAPPGAATPLKMEDYFPPSYSLTLGSDKIELLNHMQAGIKGEDDSAWIIKPASANCGKGIVVSKDYAMIMRDHLCWHKGRKHPVPPDVTQETPAEQSDAQPVPSSDEASGDIGEGYFGSNGNEAKVVIQRYIPNPLLLGGRKFDVRCYMLVASTKPYLVLFRGGYVRRSLSPYCPNDLSNRFAHLTNAAVQKKHEDYEAMREDSIWSMEHLQAHLEASGASPPGWVSEVLTPQMRRVCSEVFHSARPKLQARRGFFELLGIDFLIDEALRPWLLEVNTNPALWVNSVVQMEVIPPLVQDTLAVAVSAWQQTRDGGGKIEARSLQSITGFDVVYDESAEV